MDTPEQSDLTSAGASYPTEYIMDVKLNADSGSDMALYDQRIQYQSTGRQKGRHGGTFEGRTYYREQGGKYNYFDSEKEDYWLFCVQLMKNAVMEIAIGGEKPVRVNSQPSWLQIDLSRDDNPLIQELTWFGVKASHKLTFEWAKEGHRLIAVRCPKMSNPAISVRASGDYAALEWVGLFVKNLADNGNQFVAVKTTNRLLPDYAQRTIHLPGADEWFRWGGPVDVMDRTLTLFPKQLYGTSGDRRETYDQYVSTDPTKGIASSATNQTIGEKHFEVIHDKVRRFYAPRARKYVWNLEGDTLITIMENSDLSAVWKPHSTLNYITGNKSLPTTVNGWKMLFAVFTTVAGIATGILEGKVAKVVKHIMTIPDLFDREKFIGNADAKGTITAFAELWDAKRKKDKEDKKKKDKVDNKNEEPIMTTPDSDSDIKRVNTATIPEMIEKATLPDSDFGIEE